MSNAQDDGYTSLTPLQQSTVFTDFGGEIHAAVTSSHINRVKAPSKGSSSSSSGELRHEFKNAQQPPRLSGGSSR